MKPLNLSLLLIVSFLWPQLSIAAHDEQGKMRCLDCHVTIPFDIVSLSFHEDISSVCYRCHNAHQGEGNHPVEIFPTMEIPEDMPLDRKGYMTCITCHSFHNEWQAIAENKNKLLRRENGPTFCFYCHGSGFR